MADNNAVEQRDLDGSFFESEFSYWLDASDILRSDIPNKAEFPTFEDFRSYSEDNSTEELWCIQDLFHLWMYEGYAFAVCETFVDYLRATHFLLSKWTEEGKLEKEEDGRLQLDCFPPGDWRKLTSIILPADHPSGYGGAKHPALQESTFRRYKAIHQSRHASSVERKLDQLLKEPHNQ